MATQEIIRPLGLITQPNRAGAYPPGALNVATGVYMRDPLVLTTQREPLALGSSPWPSNITQQMYVGSIVDWQYDFFALYVNASTTFWNFTYATSAGAAVGNGVVRFNGLVGITPTPSEEVLTSQKRFSWTVNGKRLVIPFRDSVVEWVLDPNSSGATELVCGLGPPQITFGGIPASGSATNGALLTSTHCHVVAVHRRVLFDGSETVSAPSNAIQALNNSGNGANISVIVSGLLDLKVGDWIDIYRTRPQNLTTNTGATYLKSTSFQVASLTANLQYSVTDTTVASSLGEALYTNTGVRGAAAANFMAPKCKNVATFKGHTFYLNVTDPPAITESFTTGIGTMTSGGDAYVRANGLGLRTFTGTVSNGGALVTGISAADIVGIQLGQRFFTGGAAPVAGTATRITSISPTSFGTNSTWSTAGSFSLTFVDVVEIDGTTVLLSSVDEIAETMTVEAAAPERGTMAIQMLDRVLVPTGFTFPATIPAVSLSITRPTSLNSTGYGPITIRGTNGDNWVPRIPDINATVRSVSETNAPNRIRWSEQGQPGACPPGNFLACGSGELYVGVPTRDCLWVFASDGLWRLSGSGGIAGAPGYDWALDPVDPTLSLAGPLSWCVLRDTVYAYTNRGLVAIDSSGDVRELTQGRLNDRLPGPPWSPNREDTLSADETNDEVIMKIQNVDAPYVYNVLTDAFTQLSTTVSGVVPLYVSYSRADQRSFFHYTDGIRQVETGNTVAGMQVDYQPIYADDTWQVHRWQRVNLVFNAANGGSPVTVVPRINQSNQVPTSIASGTQHAFARGSVAVPRNAPAMANNIMPGYAQASNGPDPLRFFGVSLDYITVTQQRKKR